jgi:rSAM/selenodomain-associated transferase 2
MHLSIIIPVLNDAAALRALLHQLAPLRAQGVQIVVADGGSTDGSAQAAAPLADVVLTVTPPGRAAQQHAGATAASGDVLWFLHADCAPPAHAYQLITQALQAGAQWGRFDVLLHGKAWVLPLVAYSMSVRSRLTGICTGDQGIFVRRTAYVAVGGMAPVALMEDIALSKALKRVGRPACIAQPLVASGRRWDNHGALRTILLMWWLRLRYFFGADPTKLARIYYNISTTSKQR